MHGIRVFDEEGHEMTDIAVVFNDFARTLERQRDTLRAKLAEVTALLESCPLLFTTTCNQAEKAWIARARGDQPQPVAQEPLPSVTKRTEEAELAQLRQDNGFGGRVDRAMQPGETAT